MKYLLALTILTLGTSCGTLTRENVLMPALEVALRVVVAPAIESELEARTDLSADERAAVSSELVSLTEALASGDLERSAAIKSAWVILEPFARSYLERSVESELMAGSIRETLRLFGERVAQL